MNGDESIQTFECSRFILLIMRTIKFRVWNTKTEKWQHGPGEECNLFGEMILLGGFCQVSLDVLNDLVPCQYTGCKDKNGKEIYEGDIIASRGNYITDQLDKNGNYIDLFCVVVWNTHMSRFGLVPVKDFKFYKDDNISRIWNCSISTFREVVGNILENPNFEPPIQEKSKKILFR